MIDRYTANLDKLFIAIEKARLNISEHHIVDIVAVSKYSTTDEIKALYDVGQHSFGENKIQDLKTKSVSLEHLPIRWHYIGSLQKNKINNLIDLDPMLFHSLDSLELAYELDKKLKQKTKSMRCLLQVNSSYESSKSGVEPDEAIAIYKDIEKNCPNIILVGLMCIGANSTNTDEVARSFKTTKDIYDKLATATVLSMGMSDDFELAIKHGSNLIRVGSKLFDRGEV